MEDAFDESGALNVAGGSSWDFEAVDDAMRELGTENLNGLSPTFLRLEALAKKKSKISAVLVCRSITK